MRVHIIYAHPSSESFTYAILKAFMTGLAEAGHECTVSDLYAMGFRPELTLNEHELFRDGADDSALPSDVVAEREKLLAAQAWAFVYPNWWTDCPAIMKGWFDRVWTGFAKGPQEKPPARKALVLCTAGHTIERLRELDEYQAMQTAMLTDRIAHRAAEKSFHVFGGSAAFQGQDWELRRDAHLKTARRLGREF